MYRIYAAFIEIISASIFIIPLFFVYRKYVFNNIKCTFLYVIFSFYLVAVLALVGFPNIISLNLDFSFNIVPFIDMLSDFKNACLNILLFIPMGIFLPILWEKFRNIKITILTGLCITSIIEIIQIFTFRTTDINDIITNVVGTVIGYIIIKGITKNFKKYLIANTKNKDIYIVFGTVIIIMFFMQPFVSSLIWKNIYFIILN